MQGLNSNHLSAGRLSLVGGEGNYLVFRFDSPVMGGLHFRVYNNGTKHTPSLNAGRVYIPGSFEEIPKSVVPSSVFRASYRRANWFFRRFGK